MKPARILLPLVLLLASLAAGGAEAPLIPRNVLLANPERALPRLSPDGKTLSWLAEDSSGVLNVWASTIGKDDKRLITNEPKRPVFWYIWAADGKHILYLQDNDGDENNHLYSADLESGTVRDLTPFRGVKAQNVRTSFRSPGQVLVAMNLRDRHLFDMYRVDLDSGAVVPEAKNPGDVLTWSVDRDFVVRGATAFDPKSGQTLIRVRESASAPWRDLVAMPFEKALFNGQVVGGSLIAGFDPDGKSLLIHSALHSDKGRLVRVDLHSGAETAVLAQDPDSDIGEEGFATGPMVILDPQSGAVQAVKFDYQTPRWQFLDPGMRADFDRIGKEAKGFLRLLSRDRTDRHWILSASDSDLPPVYYAYDRDAKSVTRLFSDFPALEHYQLAAKKPVIVKARDGLSLVCYLSLPPGVEPRKLPLVLVIHGGPWARDTADYDFEAQFLANRGYAVLQVNYRGSTGLGLQFFNAGNNQWGRGTQEDIYDAVQWAIDQGIADPKRVAATGWSGGGYATLRALEQRPDLFACGVDSVGPADVATLFRSFPPYWGGILTRWKRRVGDVTTDAELNRAISPLYHVDTIKAPLLIGAGKNDVRVTLDNIDAMVKALRDAKREVVYVMYPDEGHGWGRPENNYDYYGRIENFLAAHLGGRAEPFTKVEGTSAELR
jgi:dipeptidyl aminopeptidase/acylaminoacyl peptidase